MRFMASLQSVARCLTRRSIALAAATTIGLVGSSALEVAQVSAANIATVHVDPTGRDNGLGTTSDPVRTIGRAVQLADHGATVSIAGGTYREQVQVYAKEVHLVAASGEKVVLDGAVVISGWGPSGAGRWSAPWSSAFDRAAAPFTTPDNPAAGWPEQLFLDGVALTQVTSVDDVGSGRFFHDRNAGQMTIGDSPTGHLVEGSDLNWGLYLNRADGSTVTGLVVQRFATRTKDMAAVRAYSDDLTLDTVTVVDNARIGISVIGDRVDLNDVTTIRNGHLGIHGHQSVDLTISRATVRENNRVGFDAHHSAGGIKITESAAVVVETSIVSSNGGPGIWTDLSVTDAVVRSNTVTDNARSGIEIELSSRVVVIDNTIRRNDEAGVWVLESSSVEVWHNAVYDNVRDVWVEDGPRSDVNDVTIFNNLLGGDTRVDAAVAVLNVDDWTEQRSGTDMGVRAGSNRFWLLPNRSTAVSRWSQWPNPLAVSSSIDEHRAVTGQDGGSDVVVSSTDPFGRSHVDVRQPASAPLGAEVPSDLFGAANDVAPRRAPAGPRAGPDVDVVPVGTDDPSTNDRPTTPPRTTPPGTVIVLPPEVRSSGTLILQTPATALHPAVRIPAAT
jgi:parallel beta-helix repeat protein